MDLIKGRRYRAHGPYVNEGVDHDLLGEDHIDRLDPKVAANEFSLDGAHKSSDLIAQAAHYSRAAIPAFKEKFAQHHAPEFKPFYKCENEPAC